MIYVAPLLGQILAATRPDALTFVWAAVAIIAGALGVVVARNPVHSALMLIPYFHRKQDWHVIVDEVPQVDRCDEFNVRQTHRVITDHFAVDAEARNLADNRYVRVVASNRPMLESMAKNVDCDQVWDNLVTPSATNKLK